MSALKIFFLLLLICPSLAATQLSVFVSVLPQKLMVERVGGKHVQVNVMVGKGFNPAVYQPTPRQIGELANATLYLRTGVPFEESWLPRFQAANPRMQILDLREGIELMPVTSHAHGKQRQGEALDPHIWTDPLLMDHQARLVRDWLQQQLPEHADDFTQNYQRLSRQLDDLDREIRQQFAAVEQRQFLVFHPAWGYFARRYGWQQVAAEHDGKEPSARELVRLIEQTKQQGIHKVIVQPQNNSKTARTLAEAIDGKLVVADPLAEDYFSSLRDFAGLLGESHD